MLAQEIFDGKNPAGYNQAIMDFGGVVCTPKNPKCAVCPFSKVCVAKKEDKIDQLPYREKRVKIKNRYFNYLVVENGKEIFIQKRTGSDIWKGLYELPMFETEKPVKKNFKETVSKFLKGKEFEIKSSSKEIVQLLSHQKIHFRFIHISPKDFGALRIPKAKRVKLNLLSKLALPKTIHLYLFEKSLL